MSHPQAIPAYPHASAASPQEPVEAVLSLAGKPIHAQAMSRIDGCPDACGNTEPPRSWTPTNDGYRCAYLCSDCGRAWTTDWRD